MRVVVRIPHVVWRGGRPRFSPGPRLRALGFRGEDLRTPAGAWLDIRAAEDWAREKLAEIEARKADPGARRKRPAGPRAITIEDLFEDLWKLKRLRDAGESGALSRTTARDYRGKARALKFFDPELWTAPAAAVNRSIALGLHERLWEAKGLAMANGVIAVLRLAYASAIDRRPEAGLVNPCLALRLPSPSPRVRVATPAEIAALMAAASEREPAIADAILFALLTGQRQGDVLAARELDLAEGRVRVQQGKTGARVGMKILAALAGRLAAAKARRLALGRLPTTFVVDPSGKRYPLDAFRHRFAEVRALAAEQAPSVADFRFMDLRDTAITWLANSGATIPEIAAVSGHSPNTVAAILKHYLEPNSSQADAALDKLQAWMEKQGVKL
ncbi:MAG: tyrosine-type recombinase/integrase [Roseiarcus sp.]